MAKNTRSNLCEAPKSLISYQEAFVGSEKLAMNTEMVFLKENDVWDLVEPPVGQKIVGCKLQMFTKKTGADGSVQRYKARLVVQGFTQKIWN